MARKQSRARARSACRWLPPLSGPVPTSSHPLFPRILHTPDANVRSPGAESFLRFQYNLCSDRKKYNLIMCEVKQLRPGNTPSFKPRRFPIKHAAADGREEGRRLIGRVTSDSKSLKWMCRLDVIFFPSHFNFLLHEEQYEDRIF